jgi:5,10-methylenetetrahydromethanopterin reductase
MSEFHGIGLWPGAEVTAPAVVGLAQAADLAGLHSVWFSELYYGRDAISLLAASAVSTTTIRLATGVVNPYSRHASLLAMTFATLSELAPGRIILGLGTCEPHWVQDMGYDFTRPRTAVAEALHIIDELFTNKKVDFEGKAITARNTRFMFRELPPRPEVVVAAVGPRMCALAAEAADGVLLSLGGTNLPAVVRERLGPIRPGYMIGMTIPMAVGDEEAVGHVRQTVTGLLSVPEGEAILAMSGLDPDYADVVRDDIRSNGFRRAAANIPEGIVRQLAVVGSPDECAGRIAEFVDAGVTLPIMQVGGTNTEESIKVLADVQQQLGGAITAPTTGR